MYYGFSIHSLFVFKLVLAHFPFSESVYFLLQCLNVVISKNEQPEAYDIQNVVDCPLIAILFEFSQV